LEAEIEISKEKRGRNSKTKTCNGEKGLIMFFKGKKFKA
jgi:hypothetical protein